MDEVGEMPLMAQAKLLRVLQEREINKVGGDDPVEVDVRVIATTNRDLHKEVQRGRFREDLFYRLNVIHIQLPPLAERKNDIPQLVQYFISRFNNENGYSVEGLEEGAMEILLNHNWREISASWKMQSRERLCLQAGLIKPSLFRFPAQSGDQDEADGIRVGLTVADMEKQLILKTLEHCNQNRTKAAEILGISIRTLRNKINEYGECMA